MGTHAGAPPLSYVPAGVHVCVRFAVSTALGEYPAAQLYEHASPAFALQFPRESHAPTMLHAEKTTRPAFTYRPPPPLAMSVSDTAKAIAPFTAQESALRFVVHVSVAGVPGATVLPDAMVVAPRLVTTPPTTFSSTAERSTPAAIENRYMFVIPPPAAKVRKASPPRAPAAVSVSVTVCVSGSYIADVGSAHAGAFVISVAGESTEHVSSPGGRSPTSAPDLK